MASPAIRLVLADGSEHALATPLVVGRSPSRPGYDALALPAGTVMASKNHVLVTAREQVVEITDLHSTNGTSVSVAGRPIALRPGQPTHVTVPCTFDCGDSVVRIER